MKHSCVLGLFLLLLTSVWAWSISHSTPTDPPKISRRNFLATASNAVFLSVAVETIRSEPALAVSSTAQSLIDELKQCKEKLEPIPQLLADMEWEKVRGILKVPPVNKLWNLGEVRFFVVCF